MQLCTAGTLDHSYATGDSLYRASSKVATLFKPFTRNNSIPEIAPTFPFFSLPPFFVRPLLALRDARRRAAPGMENRRRRWPFTCKGKKKRKKGGEITLQ